MNTATVSAATVFQNEIADAKQLGFQLQVTTADGQATVRAQPTTARARSACFAATGQPNQAIEAKAPGNNTDHIREAIRAVLNRAAEVTA